MPNFSTTVLKFGLLMQSSFENCFFHSAEFHKTYMYSNKQQQTLCKTRDAGIGNIGLLLKPSTDLANYFNHRNDGCF
jgi:hypothetical protein